MRFLITLRFIRNDKNLWDGQGHWQRFAQASRCQCPSTYQIIVIPSVSEESPTLLPILSSIFCFSLLSIIWGFVSQLQLSPALPVLAFYKLVGLFKIGNSHVWPIPLVINIATGENKSFHLAINGIFSFYLFTNIETT